ncbi:uncharacterized protein [Drosophila tropicalis]|uniref:uncharacterized protein n=1 Tax=Drosophila tropicalis TaxID=46794 RepID=UPI0035AB7E86
MEAPSHSQSIDISDLNDLLHDLIDVYRNKKDELLMKSVLRCIVNLIQNKNVNLCSRIFEKLISALFAACDGNADPASSMQHQLVTNILTCVQLQMTKFPSAEGKLWLDQLWSLTFNGEQVHPLAEQVLVHLFDNFVCDLGLERCLQLLKIIQQLLQAKERKNRQGAFILMHKLEKTFNTIEVIGNTIKCSHQQWVGYIAAMEHLEEQQMPVNIISFLDDMKTVNDFSCWLRILLVRLLQLENISIVNKSIKYIAANFKLTQLSEWNMLEPFLEATNRIQLYDVNEDDRLCTIFKNLILSEVESFAEALVNVPWEWHDVSLCEWLHSVPKEEKEPCIRMDLLYQLGHRVKEIQNSRLRKAAQKTVEDKFQATFDNLSLRDYLLYIQMMYKNTNYAYFDNDRLTRLVYDCDNFEIAIKSCTKVFLSAIINCHMNINLAIAFIVKLRTVSKANHGWLRIFLLSCAHHDHRFYDLYSTDYGVEISLIFNEKDLRKLQRHLLDKLICETNEEKSLLLNVSLHLFVQMHIKEWSDMEKLQLNPLQLLRDENEITMQTMGWCLEKCKERLKDENILATFVSLLKKYPDCSIAQRIARYASKHLTLEEQYTLSEDIISYHIHSNPDVVKGILRPRLLVPLHQVVQGIIHFSTLNDDACIEANYEILNGFEPISGCFIDYAVNQDKYYLKEITNKLLHMNKELSESHPQYLRNSKDHRLKFCIAFGLLFIEERSHVLDPLWSELFSSNDLINIKGIYEGIVAITLRQPDELIERLQSISSLQTSQQMSLLSVTYIYLYHQRNALNEKELKRMVELLLPLTMETDLQVLEFSQLILSKLNVECKQKGLQPQIDNTLLTSIEGGLKETSIGPELKRCIVMSLTGTYENIWTTLQCIGAA